MFHRNLAAGAPQIFSARLHPSQSPATTIVEFFRSGLREFAAWRRRRRERRRKRSNPGDVFSGLLRRYRSSQ